MEFQFRAKRMAGPGAWQRVHVDANDEGEARLYLSSQGWHALQLTDAAAPQRSGHQRRGVFPILQFNQELLALLDAGLNLYEALSTLKDKEPRPAIRRILSDVLSALQTGKSLSDALSAFPHAFPDIYIATVLATERTGDLPHALERFIAYQIQLDVIKKKVTSAAIYPAVLLAVGTLVTLFLVGYVVPRFSSVYQSTGRDIPWMSHMLLQVGKVISSHSLPVLAGLLLAVGTLVSLVRSPKARGVAFDRLLKFRVIHERVTEFRLARIYRALSLLIHAGIPLVKAMSMVAPMLLPGQRQQLLHARTAIEAGMPLSSALISNSLATPVARSLLQVGERTGRLGDMLERSAKFHDEDFARWVEVASQLLEPVLMTVIGIVIGGIVVLMYMPIFDLAGSI
jgi:general secretion pathway protein F